MKFERAINVMRGFKEDLPRNSPISSVSDRKRVETVTGLMTTTNPSDRSRALLEFVKDDLCPKVGLVPVAAPFTANHIWQVANRQFRTNESRRVCSPQLSS